MTKEIPTDFNSTYNVQIMDVEKWMLLAVAGYVADAHIVQLYNHVGVIIDRLTLVGNKKKDDKERAYSQQAK